MYFKESQRFSNAIITIPLYTGLSITILLFTTGIYKQLVQKIPFGNQPMSDATLVTVWIFTFIISILLIFIFRSMSLKISIDKYAIKYQCYPFHLKGIRVKWADVKKIEIKSFKAIRDFGRYGIRYKKNTKAYVLSEAEALFLHLNNNKTIVLETKNSIDLKVALSQFNSIKFL